MGGAQRVIIGCTALVLAILAGVFSFMSWERADQVAGVVSALVSVAALGAAGWAAIASSSGGNTVRVSGTGTARTTNGGSANTGVVTAPSTSQGTGSASIRKTGDAYSDGGNANTGFQQR